MGKHWPSSRNTVKGQEAEKKEEDTKEGNSNLATLALTQDRRAHLSAEWLSPVADLAAGTIQGMWNLRYAVVYRKTLSLETSSTLNRPRLCPNSGFRLAEILPIASARIVPLSMTGRQNTPVNRVQACDHVR